MVCGVMCSIARRVNPPMATFLFTLVMCAAGLVAYAFYITSHSLEDPDIQDWNSFLANFDHIEFCLDAKSIKDSPDALKNISAKISKEDRDAYLQNSVCMQVETTLKASHGVSESTSLLSGIEHAVFKVEAKSFGIQGELSNVLLFGYLQIPSIDDCDANKTSGSVVATEDRCYAKNKLSPKGETCLLLITKEAGVLPQYKKRPKTCFEHSDTTDEQMKEEVNRVLDIIFKTEKSSNDKSATFVPRRKGNSSCVKETKFPWPTTKNEKGKDDSASTHAESYIIEIYHKFNIDLTAFLSTGDQELINVHLVHTSYFILLIVALLIIFSLVRSNQNKTQASSEKTLADKNSDPSGSSSPAAAKIKKEGKKTFVLLHNEPDISDLDA